MTVINKAKIISVMELLMKDCEVDAMELDGKPLTGKTVGEELGKVYASLLCIAEVVKYLAENQ